MRFSLLSCGRASLLFYLGLFLHRGEAQVLTEAQAGPLYRVVGAPLSISCNVSGYSDASMKRDFEFRMIKPANPSREIQIMSTADPGFGYYMHSTRVRKKEIILTHVSQNSVVFEILSLEKDDGGEYECSVVNPVTSSYNGIYTAKTTVKVIDNSLSVSSPASDSLSFEGDALTLICQASSNTVQHTHLSLAWYLHREGVDAAQPIISMDRDFTLIPGQGFEGRYQAGLVRLDKMGEATYRLKMAQLELSDQGKIYCQAQEWIQEPDRSWYTIAQKDGEKTTLNVKAREVVADKASLAVRISAQQTTLQEGQRLMLSCNVAAQNPEERFFSVAWFRGNLELARIGPTGIVSVGPGYTGREEEGELRVTRITDRDYRLILQHVRTEDQGEYICRAWPQNRGQDGAFTQGAAQDSSLKLISISATESGLSVEMQNAVSVNEGDRLELTCKVNGVKDQISITWQRESTSSSVATFNNVVSLSQEGVMEKAGELARRRVKATRTATDTFTLELDEVTPSDSGVYRCDVSEWKSNSKTNSQAHSATVTVVPVDSFVKVKLILRDNRVDGDGNLELMCRVKGPRLPMTVSWSLLHDDSTLDNILTMYSNGAISWSGDQHRYQLKVVAQADQVFHYLLINGVSPREAGKYQCSVSVFLENVNKKLPPSNQVAVWVQNPVSKLSLISVPTLRNNINSDIDIRCLVISEPSEFSRYAVTWRIDNETIVSSDQNALVTFGPQVELSHRQRISMTRTKGPSFDLSVRQARTSDKGSYTCDVVEFLPDPSGGWYQLSPKSKTTIVEVLEPANDLRLKKKEQPLIVMEGDQVELKCNIISSASNAFFYKVIWLYTGHGSLTTNSKILELDHLGLLSYPNNQGLRSLQGRLRLSRPTQNTFNLGIHRVHEGDSGAYQCQVEQYQLDQEGQWKQTASDSADPITLTVNVAENKLSIVKEEVELNTSTSLDFTVPCHITQQSSKDSEFQVTWFCQREKETEHRSIFTAYRNSTLLDSFGKGGQLRFGHPLSKKYSITVLKPRPEDSGVYFCMVEEWLPSLSHEWRKVAEEKSGDLTVTVYADGNVDAISETECMSGTWIGILVAFVICSLLVICLLVLKICRSQASGGKSAPSLWAEQLPLATKPGTAD